MENPKKKTTQKQSKEEFALSEIKTEKTFALVPEMKGTMKEFIFQVCSNMGLIPYQGDVMLYLNKQQQPKAYICKSGYSRMANMRKISTKLEIIKVESKNGIHSALVKCIATLLKGNSHEEFGYCDSLEKGREDKPINQIIAMASTRARSRALNIATMQNYTSFDEYNENDEESKALDMATVMEKEEIKNIPCPICQKIAYHFIDGRMKCEECGYIVE